MNLRPEPGGHYRIRIAGELLPGWADRLHGMRLRHDGTGDTLLEGPVHDQAMLHGVLRTIRDADMTLISVNLDTAPAPRTKP